MSRSDQIYQVCPGIWSRFGDGSKPPSIQRKSVRDVVPIFLATCPVLKPFNMRIGYMRYYPCQEKCVIGLGVYFEILKTALRVRIA